MAFELIRDLHKDARGFRPSAEWDAMFNSASPARQQAIWDMLCEELDESMLTEERQHAAAIVAFEVRVADLIAAGAGDRATAIRWIADAEGETESVSFYGLESLCFALGLPLSYLDQKEAA